MFPNNFRRGNLPPRHRHAPPPRPDRRFRPQSRGVPVPTAAQINIGLRELAQLLPAGFDIRSNALGQLSFGSLLILGSLSVFMLETIISQANIPAIDAALPDYEAGLREPSSDPASWEGFIEQVQHTITFRTSVSLGVLFSLQYILTPFSLLLVCGAYRPHRAISLSTAASWLISGILIGPYTQNARSYFSSSYAKLLGRCRIPLPPDLLPDHLTWVRPLIHDQFGDYSPFYLVPLSLWLAGRFTHGVSLLYSGVRSLKVGCVEALREIEPLIDKWDDDPTPPAATLSNDTTVQYECAPDGSVYNPNENGAGGSSDAPSRKGPRLSTDEIVKFRQYSINAFLQLGEALTSYLPITPDNSEAVFHLTQNFFDLVSAEYLSNGSINPFNALPLPIKLDILSHLFTSHPKIVSQLFASLHYAESDEIKETIIFVIDYICAMTRLHARGGSWHSYEYNDTTQALIEKLEEDIIKRKTTGESLTFILTKCSKEIVFSSASRFITHYFFANHAFPEINLSKVYFRSPIEPEEKTRIFLALMEEGLIADILGNENFDSSALATLVRLFNDIHITINIIQQSRNTRNAKKIAETILDVIFAKMKNLEAYREGNKDAEKNARKALSYLNLANFVVREDVRFNCAEMLDLIQIRQKIIDKYRSLNIPANIQADLAAELPERLRESMATAFNNELNFNDAAILEAFSPLFDNYNISASKLIKNLQATGHRGIILLLLHNFIFHPTMWGVTESMTAEDERNELRQFDLFRTECILDILPPRYLRLAALICFMLNEMRPNELNMVMRADWHIKKLLKIQGVNLILILLASKLTDYPDTLRELFNQLYRLSHTTYLQQFGKGLFNTIIAPLDSASMFVLTKRHSEELLMQLIRGETTLPWAMNLEELDRAATECKIITAPRVEEVLDDELDNGTQHLLDAV